MKTASTTQRQTAPTKNFPRLRAIALGCLAAVGAGALPLTAFGASGTFTYVAGQVLIERNGQRLVAARGVEVDPGDVIIAGADGMAQLSMIDQAKLSLRSNSQLKIESYQRKAGDQDGAVLSLLRGTLRTFTGLLTASNREKYQMKTRVATVGIRGSGNILSHEEDEGKTPVTINHTIEGSHVVSSLIGNFAPIITFPNDTVKVEQGKPPERIPTPPTILAASNTMVGKEETATKQAASTSAPTPAPTTVTAPTPSGTGTGGTSGSGTTGTSPSVGTNIVPVVVVSPDPSGLKDVVVSAAATTYSGQALSAGLTLENGALRGFASTPGGGGSAATVTGGTAAEVQTFDIGNSSSITIGRLNSPTTLSLTGLGAFNGPSATTHFAYGSSGYPAYLSDVLTGTVAYTRVGATSPTNQDGQTGSLTTSVLSVNFTSRLLNATLGLTMPGTAGSVSYTLQAANVPFSLNSFFAITGYGLTVTNNTTGQTSNGNPNLNGAIEGSFVGAALTGAIVGYSLTDATGLNRQAINGVVAFQGQSQNVNAPFVMGLISDPSRSLERSQYSRSYSTINRPDEVTIDSSGRVTAFRGPYVRADGSIDGNSRYAVGLSRVVESGFDASTGLSWGRWSGGNATVGGIDADLSSRSLHYVFATAQAGPTTLPLTGTAVYDVVGSTRPTDNLGNVGTMNSASLSANFSARTVDATLNITVANQTWNASATGMPIYRDLTFGANTGRGLGGGLPAPTQLNIVCTPICGGGAVGSLDGFFTGRTGQGAAVQYNFNSNITGAIAFRRRG
jgi:hypothetical protein